MRQFPFFIFLFFIFFPFKVFSAQVSCWQVEEESGAYLAKIHCRGEFSGVEKAFFWLISGCSFSEKVRGPVVFLRNANIVPIQYLGPENGLFSPATKYLSVEYHPSLSWVVCKSQTPSNGDAFPACEGTFIIGPFPKEGHYKYLGDVCVAFFCEDEKGNFRLGKIRNCLLTFEFEIFGGLPQPTCGNGKLDPGEECDPKIPLDKTCQDLGFDAGELKCNPVICVYEGCYDLPNGTLGPQFVCPGDYCPPGSFCLPNPLCGAHWLEELVERGIVDFILTLGLILLPILVAFGGFLLIKSGGEEKEVKKGKNYIKFGLIGFFIFLLAKALIVIIKKIIQK